MNNPYAPPAVPPNPGYPQYPYGQAAWAPPVIEGDLVTIAKVATWPPLCVKCGTPSDLRARVQKYAWVPLWTWLLCIFGFLPALLVQMVVMKRALLTHALCGTCASRWTRARIAYAASILVPLFGGVALFLVGAALGSGWLMAVGGLLAFPGFILLAVLVHFTLVRSATLQAVFIDDRDIRLRGVAPEVLEAFRTAWPAGRGY